MQLAPKTDGARENTPGLLGKRKEERAGGGGRVVWGRGRGGGPTLLFNGRVNKSLVKLSGPQPRVFTALVSITNKSRMAPSPPLPSQLSSPRCPFSLELPAWLYWEQQIKEPSIWV